MTASPASPPDRAGLVPPASGPAAARHAAGLILVAVAAAGALGALALPAVRNTALEP